MLMPQTYILIYSQIYAGVFVRARVLVGLTLGWTGSDNVLKKKQQMKSKPNLEKFSTENGNRLLAKLDFDFFHRISCED